LIGIENEKLHAINAKRLNTSYGSSFEINHLPFSVSLTAIGIASEKVVCLGFSFSSLLSPVKQELIIHEKNERFLNTNIIKRK
jgi:hypothetical protein